MRGTRTRSDTAERPDLDPARCPHLSWGIDDSNVLSLLEQVAERLGVEVRYERLQGGPDARGGLCRVEGKDLILVDEEASVQDRIAVLAGAVAELDIEALFLPPALRERIARARGRIR